MEPKARPGKPGGLVEQPDRGAGPIRLPGHAMRRPRTRRRRSSSAQLSSSYDERCRGLSIKAPDVTVLETVGSGLPDDAVVGSGGGDRSRVRCTLGGRPAARARLDKLVLASTGREWLVARSISPTTSAGKTGHAAPAAGDGAGESPDRVALAAQTGWLSTQHPPGITVHRPERAPGRPGTTSCIWGPRPDDRRDGLGGSLPDRGDRRAANSIRCALPRSVPAPARPRSSPRASRHEARARWPHGRSLR